MALTVARTSAFDMLEAVGDDGGRARLTRQRFGELARQVSASAAITVRDEAGALVVVLGLWPEPDHLEAWLAAGPAFRANLRSALGLARAALDDAGPGEVRAYARGLGPRVAGARMAAWLGFEPAGEEPTRFGPVQVFRLVSPGAPNP
jgi:hypothetical protein